jgi:hypothetical protein
MGGPDMAPHTPQRSEHPGGAGALLDLRRTPHILRKNLQAVHYSNGISRVKTVKTERRVAASASRI